MGWFAFAFLLVISIYAWWRIWRDWIAPWRALEQIVEAITEEKLPRTFLIRGSARARRIGLALENLALRQRTLLARAEEGEFNVQTIMGALPDGLLVADQQQQVRLVNGGFRRLFGAEHGEEGFLEMVRDAEIARLLGQVLVDGEPRRGTLALGVSSEGERHLEVRAEPIKVSPGEVRGAVVLFRDVTELRNIEAMRRDFVANVSHELRTPLSILRGYLETLLEDPQQPPAELLRIFQVMERHSNRLNLLVEDVLSLARLEAPAAQLDLTTVRIGDFLRAIMHDWEEKFAAKNLETQFEAPDDLPALEADEGRLQELVYNLLDNAVKYSNNGGRIVVRVRQDGAAMRLSVSDAGSGIPARDLPRIFERFYRADKARHGEPGGTGLGLSIVKHIAQLHGGSVEAASEVGQGTTITVVLPQLTSG